MNGVEGLTTPIRTVLSAQIRCPVAYVLFVSLERQTGMLVICSESSLRHTDDCL
jgi:hypothetical protein